MINLKKFSSKLALNQELLNKNKAIKDGEVVVVKMQRTGFGDQEIKYLLKKCNKCGELFLQSERCKFVYVCCDKCAKLKHKGVFVNG